MAAVAPFHKKKQQYQHTGRRGNGTKSGNTAAPAAVTGKAERLASGLCRYHWKFREEARFCVKLVRRGRINAVAPGRLVHIADESTQRRFLVDTGAAYSIFPFSSSGKQSGPHLMGADGLHIPCWGERRLSLIFHGRRFEWPFSLAKVHFHIIGVDFLRHFKLLLDPAANRLVDTVSTQLLPTVSSVRSQPEPANTSAMAAATPAGRPAQS